MKTKLTYQLKLMWWIAIVHNAMEIGASPLGDCEAMLWSMLLLKKSLIPPPIWHPYLPNFALLKAKESHYHRFALGGSGGGRKLDGPPIPLWLPLWLRQKKIIFRFLGNFTGKIAPLPDNWKLHSTFLDQCNINSNCIINVHTTGPVVCFCKFAILTCIFSVSFRPLWHFFFWKNMQGTALCLLFMCE